MTKFRVKLRICVLGFVAASLASAAFAGDRGKPISLFDGKSLAGWTSFDGKPITKGWIVRDGMLERIDRGGHIYYKDEVGDFELSFEWKLAKGGNSGIKYRVRRYNGRILGCEYQLLDDRGKSNHKGATGSLYALYAPNQDKQLNPSGEWNTSKIVVDGTRIEHWLNGKKIVEAIVGSEDWLARVKSSKFSEYKDFSQNRTGRLMLQDHGGAVSFRKIVLVPIHSDAVPGNDVAAAAKGVKQIIAHRGASLERPECTVASIRRSIEVGATAVEMDVRTSKDGTLFLLHDATLDRTTNGKGSAAALTIAELQQLDAGSWFKPTYKNERIPTLDAALRECRGKIDALLDLKEQGDEYDRKVAAAVRKHGMPSRTVVGVRSIEQAQRFRKLLPEARQIGLIPNPDSIEGFVAAGVETIRLWPKWLAGDGVKLVDQVRTAKAMLHLNGTSGTPEEIVPLLAHSPDSLSSDDPGRLVRTLKELADRK
ncbi:MAG: DUF1080 domain-containing protein [Planctomycetota bacterium]|nr:DUF1080 domain-containing protein [Planctomycetota bacterium]